MVLEKWFYNFRSFSCFLFYELIRKWICTSLPAIFRFSMYLCTYHMDDSRHRQFHLCLVLYYFYIRYCSLHFLEWDHWFELLLHISLFHISLLCLILFSAFLITIVPSCSTFRIGDLSSSWICQSLFKHGLLIQARAVSLFHTLIPVIRTLWNHGLHLYTINLYTNYSNCL